jgi:polysaccharide export outer membrane protein
MKTTPLGNRSLPAASAILNTSAILSMCWCCAALALYGQVAGEQSPDKIVQGGSAELHGEGANSLLGPGDVLSVKAAEADEVNSPAVRIDTSGFLNLPLVGRLQAAGMSIEALEAEIGNRLRAYVKRPEVTVSVVEYHSQPVSILGSVANPGVHQVQGHKSLAEVIALAGGLRQDAGYSVRITRRAEWGPIPLPNAAFDPTKQFSIAEVSTRSLLGASNPRENIQIQPDDIITVPRAEMIYIQGQVRRPGGYVLRDSEHMSVLVAVSLAEGLDRTAAPHSARILRVVSGQTHRAELSVDLKRILDGKAPDFMLEADDILYVPSSLSKTVSLRTIESAVQIGTGLAIVRP